MSGLVVRELPKAQRDLQQIATYLRKRSPQGTHAWLDAYDAAVERVSREDYPRVPAPEAGRVEEDLHQVVFMTKRGRPYRIIYLIDSGTLYVVRVRGPGQNLLTKRGLGLG